MGLVEVVHLQGNREKQYNNNTIRIIEEEKILHLHLGHLADALRQNDLNKYQKKEEQYRCRYS